MPGKKQSVPTPELPVEETVYASWLQALKDLQGGRPGYKDQTVASLAALVGIVRQHQIETVIELGTSYGASTRAWAYGGAKTIHVVDLWLGPFHQSLAGLPLAGPARVIEHEGPVASLDLSGLSEGRTLVFFDCHGADNMRYALNQWGRFPAGSVFAVDDLWYSPEPLAEWEARGFAQRVVEADIDTSLPMSLWPQSYANFWSGGAFYGFDEVQPLLQYLNQEQIAAEHAAKTLWWRKGA